MLTRALPAAALQRVRTDVTLSGGRGTSDRRGGLPLLSTSSRSRWPVVVGLACLLVTCRLWAQDEDAEVTIPDEGLRCAITAALDKEADEAVTRRELATLTELTSSCDEAIEDLTGLEYATRLATLKLPGNAIADLGALSELANLARLDLSDNAVADIEPLAGLTNLTLLELADNAVVDIGPLARLTGLGRLTLDANTIADIEPLAGLTALTWLDLSVNAVVDIGALARLTALETLELDGNAVADIGPLAGLTALTWLLLHDNAVVDIEPLAGLTALKTLNLGGNAIADIGALADLTDLTWLRLTHNAVIDIGPLARLTALTSLNLSDNGVVDIGHLAGLTALTWLYLDDNAVVDIEPLAGLTALGTLDLTGNAIADIGPLADLTGLTWLDLDDNAVVDIEPLVGLGALETLDLASNRVADIGPLAGLTDLTWLRLDDNAVVDIEPLTGLTALGTLSLASNRVTDIGPLAGLTALTWLRFDHNAVVDVEPLAGLTALRTLRLVGNAVEDIEPLAGLTALQWLALDDNAVVDVEPLAGLTALVILSLNNNMIADIAPLSGLTALGWLTLGDNAVVDIRPLADLTVLWNLTLNRNMIADIGPLAELTRLTSLRIGENGVADIGPLAALTALLELDLSGNAVEDIEPVATLPIGLLNVKGNPLNAASVATHLQRFREAHATVRWNWEHEGRQMAWFVPAANAARQGFVRVVNRSPGAGHASIVAIDDRGRRYGPLTLALDGNETVHFNSDDLEAGNPGKGLSEGTGPGDGDWRLEFDSELELDVLTYMRTSDGFLTALHDVVPVGGGTTYLVPTFNPGSNRDQASSLRIVNPGSEDAEVTIAGNDDNDRWSVVRLDLAAGESVTLTASELESGVGLDAALHDGAGKWRLSLNTTQPVVAISLLSSPTGHLTNLSTWPARIAGAYRVPFFPSAADELGRQGFVRIRNWTAKAGLVRVEAYDDSDAHRKAVVFLRVGARETRHFNSHDLELGNDGKGLVGSTGSSNGDWLLTVSSRRTLSVMSYIRTDDGFLTSMHDPLPRVDGVDVVAMFNPGSNVSQVSSLRLTNYDAAAREVTITGTDDDGSSRGTAVTLTVPGHATRTLSAAELETGGPGLNGALGDGRGKWRLRVESDADVAVMHVLESPTGHLTNLSTAPDIGGS